jgi:hypothetical protein
MEIKRWRGGIHYSPQLSSEHFDRAHGAVDPQSLAGSNDRAHRTGRGDGGKSTRHTMAACDIIPPMSVTVALILLKTGAQLGAVTGATRISPSKNLIKFVGRANNARGAFDDPRDTAIPTCRELSVGPFNHAETRSPVMPHSMIVVRKHSSHPRPKEMVKAGQARMKLCLGQPGQ